VELLGQVSRLLQQTRENISRMLVPFMHSLLWALCRLQQMYTYQCLLHPLHNQRNNTIHHNITTN
jgi:hypothetical protein